jgi:hypothetical protein
VRLGGETVALLVGGGICAVGAGRFAGAVRVRVAADGEVCRPGVVSGSREAALPIREERTRPRIANARTATKSATAA